MPADRELARIVKEELGGRGYVVDLQTRREGEHVVGTLEVTSAETDETVAKLVGVGNIDSWRLCFGVDAEGTIRDIILKALGAWQGVRNLMPSVVLKAPGP